VRGKKKSHSKKSRDDDDSDSDSLNDAIMSYSNSIKLENSLKKKKNQQN